MRFRGRHVHRTIALHLETELRALGWKTQEDVTLGSPVILGALPVSYEQFEPDEVVDIQPNVVSITLGDEPSARDEELGDGLRELALPVFVDIYAENQSTALSIAADV